MRKKIKYVGCTKVTENSGINPQVKHNQTKLDRKFTHRDTEETCNIIRTLEKFPESFQNLIRYH